MQINTLNNIQAKLLTPFVIAIVVIVAVGVWSFGYHQAIERLEIERQINRQLSNNFSQSISDEMEQMNGFLFFIANQPQLQKLWLKRDRKAILRFSDSTFRNLKQHYQITHFYFHLIDGTNFLRVHSPDRNGDLISRATLQQAIKTERAASGIEFGTFGQFVLRAVIPWKINGKLVGFIELGKEIDQLIERLSINNGYPLILALDKHYLYSKQLEKTEYFKRKDKLLSQRKNVIVINQTLKFLPNKLDKLIDSEELNIIDSFEQNGKEFMVSKIPINDFQKQPAAFLYFLVDLSAQQKHQNELGQSLSKVGLTLAIVLFAFYFFYSKRLSKFLSTSYQKLEREIDFRRATQESLSKSKSQLEALVEERDISLEQSNKRYQTLFDKTADALLIIEGHQFVDCNQATLEMLGYLTKEELYNTHPSKLSPEYQPDGEKSETKADKMIETAFKNGSHRFEWEHCRKNGDIFPVEVLLTAIPLDGSQLLHVVWRDISARKKAAAEIEHQAYYDSLTALPNRQLLLDRLGQAFISSRRHQVYSALFFIDLDRFKSINDSLGHTIGDRLLIETAKRIKSTVWDEDTVARFGGDEYVVLLKNLGHNKDAAGLMAKKIATRIQLAFQAPFVIENQSLHITASIGIALFPIHEEGIEDIVKQADTAMYSAKESGRNQIAFYLAEMHEKAIHRLNLEKDLRAAIKEKCLEVYYQPQFDPNATIIGAEALIRWKHPEYGFINPEEFIAIAEDTGLIYDIGDFVLRKAIEDILSINQHFQLNLTVSVNVSPHQLKKEDFVGKIKSIMENSQLRKGILTLEVTEGIAIENLTETIKKFDELRHVGVNLSLDDFGTGYSSLSHLKRLPINELKIDRSFVFDITEDPQDALLVQTIIGIGHRFGLKVVAEGVETEQQKDFLRYQDCDIYQGYYYSRPLPLNDLKSFIAHI